MGVDDKPSATIGQQMAKLRRSWYEQKKKKKPTSGNAQRDYEPKKKPSSGNAQRKYTVKKDEVQPG